MCSVVLLTFALLLPGYVFAGNIGVLPRRNLAGGSSGNVGIDEDVEEATR
jgi:hypothetical protein